MTMPSTSPIAQPVRQCNVALTAARFSDCACSWCIPLQGIVTLNHAWHPDKAPADSATARLCGSARQLTLNRAWHGTVELRCGRHRRAPRTVPGAARPAAAVRDAESVGRGLGAAARG